MGTPRFTPEFKEEAVRQITERGYSVPEVSDRLGVYAHSLFARKVVWWSMKPTLSLELAPDALMMAVWRRKPESEVIVHSDQGSLYGSDDWQRSCRANHLTTSMSRDNAVAESFFSSLK